MKIAILAAGSSKYFPLLIDKPKCLYHLNGMIQLQRVIEDAKQFVDEKDIIVVAGYKYKYVKNFLNEYYPFVKLKVNENYKSSAIYSFRKAVEGESDDIVFMLGDESISRHNIERIASSKRKMAILCHDDYYYYSVGILKLRKDIFKIIEDDKYLSMDAMKEIYCFANNKEVYDGDFTINSGICLGYIFIDLVRRVGGIEVIENPVTTYKGEDIDFIHFNPKEEYTPDLDYFSDTDEYKNSKALRFYSNQISDRLRHLGRAPRKVKRIVSRWIHS